MSVPATEQDRPLTWEEYERLPEDPRVEYVDGRLLVSPSPTRQHQQIGLRLAVALGAVLPATHDVTLAWSWRPARDEFVPDVMVFDRARADAGPQARFEGVPALAVEVLSSNRGDDLVRKVGKYAAAGLPRYWIVDPRDRVLDAFVLDGSGGAGVFVPAGRLDADTPRGVLDLGLAEVALDLPALLD